MKQRNPFIDVQSVRFERIPVKTSILTKDDDMLDIVKEYALPLLQKGDIISISESPLAITQGRAVLVAEMKIGLLAKILWRFVAKVPYGIGLRAPSSMQCAIDECGAVRIIFAAMGGALGKLVGVKGLFYQLAGKQAALIDACGTSPVPPYNETVIKGPLYPEQEAQRISNGIGYPVAVMDINDIGGSWMIGGNQGLSKNFMETVMKDNPQGQGDELTPICIIRRVP
jgi:hypothetical protein